MPRIGPVAARFIRGYSKRYEDLEQLASISEGILRELIKPLHLDVHQVAARAKSAASVVAKVRAKKYGRPAQQLTDQVGARIIVYYAHDVDTVAAALRQQLEVDERNSIDKRTTLELRQFGYRSLHLIARLGSHLAGTKAEHLGSLWIEIQVRSVLEHAWAEIEHEICYKSGAAFPKDMLRRFGAIAGTLEILEQQFATLRRERDLLVDDYRAAYVDGAGEDAELDAPRLVALLEAWYPDAPGWRTSMNDVKAFEARSEVACLDAVKDCGVLSGRDMRRFFGRRKVARAIEEFASLERLDPRVVSHKARITLAVGAASRDAISSYPELFGDINIRRVLKVA